LAEKTTAIIMTAVESRYFLRINGHPPKSSKQVATALNIVTKTAETHRANIMRKLGVHSVRDLVVYAIKNNIIQVQTPSDSDVQT
jgi:DNA-binding CsgD family transcriptional regulator